MKIKELLPIGSVVLLNGGEKRIMVYGVKQSDDSKPGEEFDYIGVMYPEGNIGTQYQFLFNHNDINNVIFRGFEDDERVTFLSKLSELYE